MKEEQVPESMEKEKELTLSSFNDILVNTGGIDRKELLRMEIQTAYGLKISKMEELVELMNEQKNIREIKEVLQQVNNIDSNINTLADELQELDPDAFKDDEEKEKEE